MPNMSLQKKRANLQSLQERVIIVDIRLEELLTGCRNSVVDGRA